MRRKWLLTTYISKIFKVAIVIGAFPCISERHINDASFRLKWFHGLKNSMRHDTRSLNCGYLRGIRGTSYCARSARKYLRPMHVCSLCAGNTIISAGSTRWILMAKIICISMPRGKYSNIADWMQWRLKPVLIVPRSSRADDGRERYAGGNPGGRIFRNTCSPSCFTVYLPYFTTCFARLSSHTRTSAFQSTLHCYRPFRSLYVVLVLH